MRPRQNLRDFHHNSQPPSYQPMNHNQNFLQQQLQQSMAPAQPPSGTPPLLGQSVGGAGSVAPRPIQTQLPTPDIISELLKLGLNPEELAKQLNRPDRRDDLVKSLLGKREAADLLQKLPPLNNLFMQSLKSADFARNIGGVNSRDSVICGPSGMVGGGGASGPTSFTNDINNGNPGKQEQDIQYSSAQHQANHHQHFRIPTTNTTTVHNSPQQQQQQQQQQRHKSVLSIHQQQHQHDPTNRRLNHQQLSMSGASSSSFTNLNEMSGRAPQPSPSSALESHDSTIFNRGKTSPPLNSYALSGTSTAPRATNLMNALGATGGNGGASSVGCGSGGHSGQLDNIYDNTAFQQHNSPSSNHQQSLLRHQQLQRLLRASASGAPKNSAPLQASNMPSRNDQLTSQRPGNNLSQVQRQLASPNTSSAISSPQQTFSSVPKSLLNLAACTSKSPPNANISSILANNSRALLQQQKQASFGTNYNNDGSTNPMSSNRAATSRGQGGLGNTRAPNPLDPSNLLQQMIARSNQAKNSNSVLNRSNPNNQALTSLLSDDQKNVNPAVGASSMIAQQSNNSNRSSSSSSSSSATAAASQPATILKRQARLSDEASSPVQTSAKSKKAYLAYLQERAAKAGISIGEINKATATNQLIDASQFSSGQGLDSSVSESGGQLAIRDDSGLTTDEKEGDVRNDLSLLYPPISLSSASQKQVNILAAGLEYSDEFDIITDEVRKIIQEECNIIYECKGCSNLFRSLANLVKHKRQFCDNSNIERANAELNKQFLMNDTLAPSKTPNTVEYCTGSGNSRGGFVGDARDASLLDNRRPDHLNASVSIGSQKYNLRGRRIDSNSEIGNDGKLTRITRSHQRDLISANDTSLMVPTNVTDGGRAQQTNLSRLLQSQPKNRQQPNKDSALMDALNMPNPTANIRRSVINNNNPRSCSINELNEHLVKNSSLAKTLLNENAKSINSAPQQVNTRSATQRSRTIPNPKRKLLEDCIQKVKRDKLSIGEEGDPEDPKALSGTMTDQATQDDQRLQQSINDMNQLKDPLALDDSSTDSEALVMDLDEPSCTPKSGRRSSRQSEDRGQEATSAVSKLNTSSALLKALTRPVETRSTHVNSLRPSDDKVSVASSTSATQDASSVIVETGESEARSNSTREGSVDDTSVGETGPEVEVVALPSPLFDRSTCEMCETDFEDQGSLMAHMMRQHKKEKKIYPCLFCSFTFISLENVCRHIIDMHKKTKTQVGHLKEVVRSRSFISHDFATCSDCPADDQENDSDDLELQHKLQQHEQQPQQPETNQTKAEGLDTRRSSSVLSDATATKQILEDTLNLVSTASSPETTTMTTTSSSTNRLAAILSRARQAGRQTASAGEENKNSGQGSADDAEDDPLCDSLLNNLTEHLAILESQEAEIEAEKLRRTQGGGSASAQGGEGISHAPNQNDLLTSKAMPGAGVNQSLVRDDETSEVSLECRNQQTTPSRGKHIVAGQPPSGDEEALNSDQDEEGDEDDEGEDDEQDFEQGSQDAAANDGDGSYGGMKGVNEVEEGEESEEGDEDDEEVQSRDDGSNDEQSAGAAYVKRRGPGRRSDVSENDDSQPPSSPYGCRSNSESNDNEEEEDEEDYQYDGDEEYARHSHNEKEFEAWTKSGLKGSSEREPRKRRSSRGGDHYAADDDLRRSGDGDGADIDLNPSRAGGKTAAQNLSENVLSRESCSHSTRGTPKAATMETSGGAGDCKLKVKSSMLRDVGGSSGSAAGGSSSQARACSSSPATAAGEGSGGGIKKLKIQLKAQPDEKSKVYRIVN